MSEKGFSQSINISGGQYNVGHISGNQVGSQFNQNLINSSSEDFVYLVAQLEECLLASGLSATYAEKVLRLLRIAKEEAESSEADKDFIAMNLQRAIRVLDDASTTSEEGSRLWDRIAPIVNKLRLL